MAYRKSGPLTRINILAQISIKASSFADEAPVVIGHANNTSHTDRTDGSGSVCVSRGASHRLRMRGQRIVNWTNQTRTRSSGEVLDQDPSNASKRKVSMILFASFSNLRDLQRVLDLPTEVGR